MMISWILFGLVIGAIARYIYPGRQGLGILKTMLLGIAGSFVGGFLGWLIVGGSILQSSGWLGSILGAIIVLAFASRQSRITAS
ncbi:GlsB/YeaQ/YmgE family stress response membrane protein [Planctomycetes bacterium K23_9]